jgi:hypothetical protein
MITIWKFALRVASECVIDISGTPEFLTAQMQCGRLCVWAIIDDAKPYQRRLIRTLGTGHDASGVSINRHIGTVIDGTFVWHIFDGGPV